MTRHQDDRDGNSLSALEMLQIELDRLQPGSVKEAQEIADRVRDQYNRTAQPELQGLSPEQAYALTRPDWIDVSLHLSTETALTDWQDARLFQFARCVLCAVRDEGTVKATATGAFNRKFATLMFDIAPMSEITRDFLRRHNKVINQGDVPSLELTRHLLPQAGLLLYRKGMFRVTKRGAALLADDKAGELAALLFRTFFTRISFEAMDGLPENLHVQRTAGFALYQVSRINKWTDIDESTPMMFLPGVRDTMKPSLYSPDPARDYFRLRILRHLNAFGLVEYDKQADLKSPQSFRKTALFDRFIEFRIPTSLNASLAPKTYFGEGPSTSH